MNTKKQKKNSVELTQENFANVLSPTKDERFKRALSVILDDWHVFDEDRFIASQKS